MYRMVMQFGGYQLQRVEDGKWIMEISGDPDYEAYLAWVAEGNVAPYYNPDLQ